jgi:hypothetical protein
LKRMLAEKAPPLSGSINTGAGRAARVAAVDGVVSRAGGEASGGVTVDVGAGVHVGVLGGVSVEVGVGSRVWVGVADGVVVCVKVGVLVGVSDGVVRTYAVRVGVGVKVDVSVGVNEGDAVSVGVDVLVGDGDGVSVGVAEGVERSGVDVSVDVGMPVCAVKTGDAGSGGGVPAFARYERSSIEDSQKARIKRTGNVYRMLERFPRNSVALWRNVNCGTG